MHAFSKYIQAYVLRNIKKIFKIYGFSIVACVFKTTCTLEAYLRMISFLINSSREYYHTSQNSSLDTSSSLDRLGCLSALKVKARM